MDKQESVSNRKQLESRLLLLADKIVVGSECFDEEIVQDFFSAWRDLIEYYREHDDYEIGVEVVREYNEWTNVFGGMKYNSTLDSSCQERSEEAFEELKAYMSEIVLIVTRKLHPQGR